MWNINANGAYPWHDFNKICSVCTSFLDALGVKISMDLLKGLWSYGGFKLMCSGYPQIFTARYRRNYASHHQTFWRCKNVLEVLYHHAKFGGARISPASGKAENVEFFLSVCLFVCLFVRHAFERQRLCAIFRNE